MNIQEIQTAKEAHAKVPPPSLDCVANRQAGKSVLKDIIHRLRRRAEAVQILHDTLPEKMSPQQDEAIWQLACSLERQ